MSNKSSRLSLVSLLLFIVAFSAAWFYLKPTWDEVSSMGIARDEKLVERKDLNQKLVDLQKVQQELNLTSEVARETTLSAIPVQLEQEALIRDISSLAKKNDMTLGGLSFSISTGGGGEEVSKTTINTNVTGSYNNLISFLKGIETNDRKLLLKNITVQVGDTEYGSRVNFNLNMEAYYQGRI